MKTIYLDNNATTAVAPEALEAAMPYLRDQFFNPSSMYEQARRPAETLAASRRVIASGFGGVDEESLIFTSGATESNNTAVFGAMKANAARRHIVTSAVEHPSVLEVVRDAERMGAEVTVVPVLGDGSLDMTAFVRALRPDTLLVSMMHGNNETGVIFPVDELARITKETNADILFHTDATQTVGKLPIDLTGTMKFVDMLSFSGHKLHAPKGVGALFVRRGTACRPTMVGGHQERGRRAGTENVAGIAALGKACELAWEHHDEGARIERLRDRLQEELRKRIPFIQVNGEGSPRLANTLNVSCHYIEGESILYELNERGICASSGSACTSGSLDPSHVLKALKVPFTAIHGSIRFSMSRYSTEEEIDDVIETLPVIVANLRRLSPYWDAAHERPRANAPSQ